MILRWKKTGARYTSPDNKQVYIYKSGDRYMAHRVFNGVTSEASCETLAEAKSYCGAQFMVYSIAPCSNAKFVAGYETAVEAEARCKAYNAQRRNNTDPTYFC